MKTQKFKTNIACSNCLAKVTPVLNAEPKINSWEVDLQSEDRILTVDSDDITADEVFKTVLKAGFIAKPE
ncbi:heavy-metal-associated domain-containing protein [Algoriphagus sp. D3-2-R+10]|uniref:heavy-metal-associated domain-containing protein n=1 Tax=Algoriphagus aurantiacus TaxID=3103948 RepID=UPI002B37CB7E|nr:heavy-metal-associated domain-containing protein [Algoriphagus sp. D3-2-R+10]MEB2775838.1 heavy-metal-associated domain-containing protein [Algoriphagus sp. D3-2-R+10]